MVMTIEKQQKIEELCKTYYKVYSDTPKNEYGDNQHVTTFSNDMLEDYLSKSKKIDQTELPVYYYYYNTGILVYDPNN